MAYCERIIRALLRGCHAVPHTTTPGGGLYQFVLVVDLNQ